MASTCMEDLQLLASKKIDQPSSRNLVVERFTGGEKHGKHETEKEKSTERDIDDVVDC